MSYFRRVADRTSEPGGPAGGRRYRFVARFSATDATLLRELVRQVTELLGGTADPPGADPPGAGQAASLEDALGLTDDPGVPDDPALARLLPDAYRDDPQAASEFRHYTEKDLRAGKIAAAQTVLDTLPAGGGKVNLSEPDAQAWLRALNDMRLALGVRLGVTDDFGDELGDERSQIGPADPRYGGFAVYDWLTATQETLVRALW